CSDACAFARLHTRNGGRTAEASREYAAPLARWCPPGRAAALRHFLVVVRHSAASTTASPAALRRRHELLPIHGHAARDDDARARREFAWASPRRSEPPLRWPLRDRFRSATAGLCPS